MSIWKKGFQHSAYAFLTLLLFSCSKSSNNQNTNVNNPTVTTVAISSITSASAISGGSVTSAGSTAITARGVCWGTSANPSISDSHTTDGTGTGSFTSNISGLLPSTAYYVRAYATNSAGTAYGTQVTFTTLVAPPTLTIGMNYGGGVVAYILQSGDPGYDASVQHGLIAATSDQSTGFINWGCGGTLVGTTGTTIGTGLANTDSIVSHCGTSTGAYICDTLVITGGYFDWYLPSKDELNKLYLNRNVISGMSGNEYMSSSEVDNGHYWAQDFSTGSQLSEYKLNSPHVRAVRSF